MDFTQRLRSKNADDIAHFTAPIPRSVGHLLIRSIFSIPHDDTPLDKSETLNPNGLRLCFELSALHASHRLPPFIDELELFWRSEAVVSKWVQANFVDKKASKSHYLLEGSIPSQQPLVQPLVSSMVSIT